MTVPFAAAALEPELVGPLVLALPKGRILAECGELLGRADIVPAPDYADEEQPAAAVSDQRAGARRGAGAPVRRGDLRRLRSGATRHLRGRRADGVRLPGNLCPARPRHRALPDRGGRAAETAGSDDPTRWSRVRVATKYPNVARRHFAARGVHAEVVDLSGAMELAPSLGLARLIVDLVQTGSTLKANGLIETEVIAPVTSRLIVNRTALKTRPEAIGGWIERFRAALGGRDVKRLVDRRAGLRRRLQRLLAQARETTRARRSGGGGDHRRRPGARRRGADRLYGAVRPADADGGAVGGERRRDRRGGGGNRAPGLA